MASFSIGRQSVGLPDDGIFIIAEIGQNHQGNIQIAKELISEAKRIGCCSVKFQKSCLKAKFTKSALSRPYAGENSWGSTYGEHKNFLEFTMNQYRELQHYSHSQGIMFSASAMDEVSLEQLHSLRVPFIKIGSGDANNFPLLEKAANYDCPLIISTGMQTSTTLKKIVEIMRRGNKKNFALLHCVSCYPTKSEDCNLLTIPLLRNMFPDVVIGYSGHETAPHISEAAALLGAKIIERHITMDKTQKGSDHSCSLTPVEFRRLIKDLRYLETECLLKEPHSAKFVIRYFQGDRSIRKALNDVSDRNILACEILCRSKLGKSLVTSRPLRSGHRLTVRDIAVKVSDPRGLAAEFIEQCIGKRLVFDLDSDVPLLSKHMHGFELVV